MPPITGNSQRKFIRHVVCYTLRQRFLMFCMAWIRLEGEIPIIPVGYWTFQPRRIGYCIFNHLIFCAFTRSKGKQTVIIPVQTAGRPAGENSCEHHARQILFLLHKQTFGSARLCEFLRAGYSLYTDERIAPSTLNTDALHPVVPTSMPRRLMMRPLFQCLYFTVLCLKRIQFPGCLEFRSQK